MVVGGGQKVCKNTEAIEVIYLEKVVAIIDYYVYK